MHQTILGFSANEGQPAKKKKIAPVMLSIEENPIAANPSNDGESRTASTTAGPSAAADKEAERSENNSLANNNLARPIKEEPLPVFLPRPIKKEADCSIYHYEEFISRVSERR